MQHALFTLGLWKWSSTRFTCEMVFASTNFKECVVQDIHDICSNLNEKKPPVNTESPQVNYSSAYNICGDWKQNMLLTEATFCG